jgi:hypothetical protein
MQTSRLLDPKESLALAQQILDKIHEKLESVQISAVQDAQSADDLFEKTKWLADSFNGLSVLIASIGLAYCAQDELKEQLSQPARRRDVKHRTAHLMRRCCEQSKDHAALLAWCSLWDQLTTLHEKDHPYLYVLDDAIVSAEFDGGLKPVIEVDSNAMVYWYQVNGSDIGAAGRPITSETVADLAEFMLRSLS